MAGFGDRLSHPAFMWLTQAHTSRRTAGRNPPQRAADRLRVADQRHHRRRSIISPASASRRTTWTPCCRPGARPACASRSACGSSTDRSATSFPSTPLPDDLKSRMGAVEILKPQPVDELSRADGRPPSGLARQAAAVGVSGAVQSRPLHRPALAAVRRAGGAPRHRHPHPSAGNQKAGRSGPGERLRQDRGARISTSLACSRTAGPARTASGSPTTTST